MNSSIEQLERGLVSGNLGLSDLLSLRRELQRPFRLHPLGFFSCTLLVEGALKFRLHYWPLAGGAQQSSECQIHDHLFEFRSWVLAGSVENIEYVVTPEGHEFAAYRTEYHGNQSTLCRTETTCKLSVLKRDVFDTGASYAVSAGVLHETVRVGAEPAFTVLVTNDVSTAAPLVFGPLDGRERYVYERTLLEDAFVEKMLVGA